MTEIKTVLAMGDVNVTCIARMYRDEVTRSFAAEFEIGGKLSNSNVLTVLSMAVANTGTVKSMIKEVDPEYMRMVMSSDHIVVDTPNMDGYKGTFMPKADGVKKFVFCYPFGYVVALNDPGTTVFSCVVTDEPRQIDELTKTPDVVVVEEMMNGDLIHIATLAVDGTTKLKRGTRRHVSIISNPRPNTIFRKSWDRVPTRAELATSGVPNARVVLVTELRTMRLKQPTVDLMYVDGSMNVIENGSLVAVAKGAKDMEVDTVYECDVYKDLATNEVMIRKPKMRVLKKLPNSMDVARRAVMSHVWGPALERAVVGHHLPCPSP